MNTFWYLAIVSAWGGFTFLVGLLVGVCVAPAKPKSVKSRR